MVRSFCHRGAGLTVVYRHDEHLLRLTCAHCGKFVVNLALERAWTAKN